MSTFEKRLQHATNHVSKRLSSEDISAIKEIIKGIYFGTKGDVTGKIASTHSPEVITAVRKLVSSAGLEGRLAELENSVSHKGSEIISLQNQLESTRTAMEEDWQLMYNSSPYTRIGVMQFTPASSEAQLLTRINRCTRDYFGDITGIPLDIHQHYDFQKVGTQTIEFSKENYNICLLGDLSAGPVFKVFKKGIFSDLNSKRKDAEARAEAILAEFGLSQSQLSSDDAP